MTTDRDFARIARAWLDLMPNEAPDRAVEAVLRAVETTSQQRSVRLGGRGRSLMHRFVLVAAVAMLGATLVGGALFLVGSRPSTDPPAPTISPSLSPPPLGEAGPADTALRADWIATSNGHPMLGNAPGIVAMSVGPSGADMSASNFGPGHGYASTVTQSGADELELTLVADGDECAAGDRGTYRSSLSEDRAELTLTLLTEDCMKRGIVFGRTWARSLTGATSVGTGVVNTIEPNFKVSLPDATYETRMLDDFIEIAAPSGSLMAFKNPQPFVDACSTDEERVLYQPGAAAFVEAFRNNDAFNVGPETRLTVDGHPVVNVVVEGKADYARCPGQPLYQYTPQACQCHFIVGQGDADSMYLVDVDGDTFLFIVSPINSPNEREIIDSIRIPYRLPGQ